MILPTTPADVQEMAANMRPEDEAEVRSITGISPMEALAIGFFHSRSYGLITGLTPKGDVAMIAGVVPSDDGYSVWMLCTPAIKGHARELLQSGAARLDAWGRIFGKLTAVVDARNTMHLKLVEKLGFQLGDPIADYGFEGIEVIPIERGHHV